MSAVSRSFRAGFAVALAAGVSACSESTAPRITLTHPAGRVAATIPLAGRPFGVAISSAGLVEATLVGAGTVAAVPLSAFAAPSVVLHPTGQDGVPTDVTFTPDGSASFVSNQTLNSVVQLDTRTGDTATFAVTAVPFRVRLDPALATLVISSGVSNDVLAVSSTTGSVIDSARIGSVASGPVNGLALHPTKPLYYASALNDGTVSEVDVATGTVLRRFAAGSDPQDVAVSPDGGELWVADESGGVTVIDLGSGAVAAAITLDATGRGGFGLAISPDGAQVYVTQPAGGNVFVLDRASRAVIQVIPTGGTPRRVAFTRDGSAAVVADEQVGLILIQ